MTEDPAGARTLTQQLEEIWQATLGEASLSRAEEHALLHRRALELARAEAPDEESGTRLEVLHFTLGGEAYAIESRYVREVYPLREIAAVPFTPPFVWGIINLRGQIISVIDLKVLLHLPTRALASRNTVIIVADATMEFGILVDTIEGVAALPLADVHLNLPTFTGPYEAYLYGVTNASIVVLDGQKLLTHPSIIAIEE
jgi:purine-binding chemotaxis protein CheW